MKLRLIKTTDEFGKIFYNVSKVNSEGIEEYISGSGTFNYEEAIETFNKLKKGAEPTKEVILESEIIN